MGFSTRWKLARVAYSCEMKCRQAGLGMKYLVLGDFYFNWVYSGLLSSHRGKDPNHIFSACCRKFVCDVLPMFLSITWKEKGVVARTVGT